MGGHSSFISTCGMGSNSRPSIVELAQEEVLECDTPVRRALEERREVGRHGSHGLERERPRVLHQPWLCRTLHALAGRGCPFADLSAARYKESLAIFGHR